MVGLPFDAQCCNEEQVVFITNYATYLLACFVLWRSRVLLPFKLFTVLMHEFSHALAAWCTCGKVHGIEVHADQGGLTTWTNRASRMKCASRIVLPAGYLGSALWGSALLVSCVNPLATRIAACILVFIVLIALGFSLCGKSSGERDWVLPGLCVALLAVLFALLYVCLFTQWEFKELLLGKVLLLLATMNTLYATYDIFEDTVHRTDERSDAFMYAQLLGSCGSPRCVGGLWFLLSIVIAVVSFLLAMVLAWQSNRTKIRDVHKFSWFSWCNLLLPATILGVAVLHRCCLSRTYRRRTTLLR